MNRRPVNELAKELLDEVSTHDERCDVDENGWCKKGCLETITKIINYERNMADIELNRLQAELNQLKVVMEVARKSLEQVSSTLDCFDSCPDCGSDNRDKHENCRFIGVDDAIATINQAMKQKEG